MRRELLQIRDDGRELAKSSLALVTRSRGSRRFSDAVSAAAGEAKVVVGSGNASVPGWLNTDTGWRSTYYLDLAEPWPVPDGSVAKVYADNVIEHFRLQQVREVLRYLLRALRPGGTVRLATPDVERAARAYLDKSEIGVRHLERHRRMGYVAEHPVDLLRVTFAQNGHHLGYLFDFETLAAELGDAGFVDVRRQEVGESADPDFTALEGRVGETDRHMMLVVEATKPDNPS